MLLQLGCALCLSAGAQGASLELTPSFTELWVADVHGYSSAEQTLVATLQGQVDHGERRIWIRQGAMNTLLLEQMVRHGVKVYAVESAWQLVEQFRDQIKGTIVYKEGTASLNAATSICSLLGAVALEESLLGRAEAAGLPVVKDVRGYDQARVLEEFGGRFNKNLLVEQSESIPFHLRDFAVANQAFVYFRGDEDFRASIGRKIGRGIPVYGWTGDEFAWIANLSKRGNYGIPADWSLNLSVLQDLECALPIRPKTIAADPVKDGERVIAFVLTDGDNIQWMGGEFVKDPGCWGNSHRGEFNMNWEMAPMLAEVAPAALGWFYATASKGAHVDDFVAGPSGAGYVYHHHLPDRAAYAKTTGAAMRKSQLSICTMLNADEGGMEESRELLDRPEIDGVIYKDHWLYNARRGQVLWHKGKPCVSYKFLLWDDIGPDTAPKGLVEAIRAMPVLAASDIGSYALVSVHAWSFKGSGGPMAAVQQTINLLPEGTRVVTVTEYFALLRSHFAKESGSSGK